LAFSYEAVPLTSLLLRDCHDLQEIDDFLRKGPLIGDPKWPWTSPAEYRAWLELAKPLVIRREIPANSAT
jgi:hypothetical protein